MVLYKFKSLNIIKYTLDIISKERLYCSFYNKLNDPFEGLFYTITNEEKKPSEIPWGFEYTRRKCQSINDKSLRVCSLSSKLEDVRLWAYYADSQKGIAVEIDFPDTILVKPVNYLETLPSFENDFEKDPKAILLKKTTHWKFENEYRIIHDNTYYPVKNKIKAIYMGTRISEKHKYRLKKKVHSRIPIYSTKINKAKIEIERDVRIN